MRLLLTGSAGFMGCHFVEHILKNTDWDIVGIDSFEHKGDSERVIKDPRYKIYCADLNAPISYRLADKIGDVDYIVNMASDSHVERSITDPVPFVRNNVNLALNVLEYARTQKSLKKFIQISTDEVFGAALEGHNHSEWEHHLPSNPYSASKSCQEQLCISYWRCYGVPVIITNCFSMDTKIMTSNGLKSYGEIEVGDNVFTLDKDERLILTPVLEKVKMPSSGKMIHIKTNKIDQLVTPNHRVMIKETKVKPRRWGDIKEVYAENLLNIKGRVRIPSCGNWIGKPLDKDYIIGDATPEDMMSIFGWYVSEGYDIKDREVCFGAGSKEQQDEIKTLLSTIGKPWVNGRSVRVANKSLNKITKQFGHLAINKFIPSFVKNCNKDLLRVFFESAIDGDGSRYPSKAVNGTFSAIVYYTKSKQLAEDMSEIGIKLGYSSRICKRKTFNPNKTKLGESYIVRFRNYQADVERQNVKEVLYSGDVWCVKTATGKVFIERNGKICLSGQTMNIVGERQDPEKFLPMLISKINKGETVTIHGNKDYVGKRYYLHARNQADAILFILKNVDVIKYVDTMSEIIKPERFNIVGDVEMDNLSLAQMVSEIMGKELKYELVDFHKARSGHDRRYALDGTKIRERGWIAPVSFKDSLKKTIQWTLAHKEWLI
jgi:dTDP-D-glucose 4,6-dehydratase